MASLDIKSLLTNIPLEETSEIYSKDLFFDISKVDLLSAGAKEWLFIFDNSRYCQIVQVAMWSPLGPTLANAFLCHYEKEWLDI